MAPLPDSPTITPARSVLDGERPLTPLTRLTRLTRLM
jgi:hypothetical protein